MDDTKSNKIKKNYTSRKPTDNVALGVELLFLDALFARRFRYAVHAALVAGVVTLYKNVK
jgi:hypothetical protein